MVFQCINIHQVPWEVLKTAAFGLGFSVFNTSHGTWRILMHEKPYLIPAFDFQSRQIVSTVLHTHVYKKVNLSYDVAVIQWITSRHKNRMTTRYITLWQDQVTS